MKKALLLVLVTLACQTGGVPGVAAPPPPPASLYSPQPPARLGGTLVVSDWEQPASLDPVHAATVAELRTASLMFAPLWGTGPGLVPYPDLVREVPTVANHDVRPGGDGISMAVTVRLVPGLRWSDGWPITADDVIFTVNATCSARLPGRDRTGFDRIASQERRSETEVVWHLGPRPGGSCGLGADLASGLYPAVALLGPKLRLLPSHLLAGVPEETWPGLDFFQRPSAVSGPFMPAGAAGGQLLDLRANPHYADGRVAAGAYTGPGVVFGHAPRLDGVRLRFYNGKAAMLAGIAGGEVDLGFHLAPEDRPLLRQATGSETLISPTLQGEFLGPNHGVDTATGRPPPWVGDPPLLAALEGAVDRAKLDTAAFAGSATITRGLFPAPMAEYAAPGGPRESPGASDAALARDGWVMAGDGIRARSGRRLEFTLVYPCQSAPRAMEGAELARQWRQVGAAVTASCRSRDELFGSGSGPGILAAGGFDMSLYSNRWDPDPSAWAPFGTPSGPDRCSDLGIERAFSVGEATLDASRRARAYREGAAVWLAYGCTIPLLEWPAVTERTLRLRNFSPSLDSLDTWNAADWWLSAGLAPA